MPRAAVVLSGCGVFDGAEVHESVAFLTHLSRGGAHYDIFAPDIDQAVVINHVTSKPAPEKRNVLVESARIARGKIAPLSRLEAADYDALFFPGGFGAARNLCNFAEKGADCTVNPEVERVVRDFRKAGKPIAMSCIAPVIAAKIFGKASGGPGCEITMGGKSDAAKAAEKMGARHVERPATEAIVDEANRLVTTPAYMCDAPIHEVFDGIGEMVTKTLDLIGAAAAR